MSKIFLYIDESKDYKNNTLYLGGIVSHLGFHAFEKVCRWIVPPEFPYELKSTRLHDRELFLKISKTIDPPLDLHVGQFHINSDTEYISAFILFLEDFITKRGENISEVHIVADFIRLNTDMKKFQKAVSRKLSNHCNLPIELEFKNSSQYRCIQLADLAVWIFRRRE